LVAAGICRHAGPAFIDRPSAAKADPWPAAVQHAIGTRAAQAVANLGVPGGRRCQARAWAWTQNDSRGSLGHWLSIRRGRILNYQIIAPTTWNFSPRDANGLPGALEQALVGAPVRDGETNPVAVQHVVRSFDPCMVCTVH
jgi:Ni,Fe-hydrogenase I large subunit